MIIEWKKRDDCWTSIGILSKKHGKRSFIEAQILMDTQFYHEILRGYTIGLDRIPEVRTLRKKIEHIANHGDPSQWSKELSKYWMDEDTGLAGTLYVDGHVRVYNGNKTSLPKR